VADEKNFYHSFDLLLFARKCPVLQGFSGINKMYVFAGILAKYGKMEQVVTTC